MLLKILDRIAPQKVMAVNAIVEKKPWKFHGEKLCSGTALIWTVVKSSY
jgi:hypothetical protein